MGGKTAPKSVFSANQNKNLNKLCCTLPFPLRLFDKMIFDSFYGPGWPQLHVISESPVRKVCFNCMYTFLSLLWRQPSDELISGDFRFNALSSNVTGQMDDSEKSSNCHLSEVRICIFDTRCLPLFLLLLRGK